MAKKVLSIEIGAHKTKLCVIDYKEKNPKIHQCILMDTPEDSIEDGWIKDANSLSLEIRNVIKENKIKEKDVIFTINSSKITTREVIIPYVKDDRIDAIVKANASDYFPMDISDYHVSYIIIEKINNKDEKNIRLLVLAAQNQLILSYYDLAEDMGLNVESIDYMGNSILQIGQKQKLEENSMVIYLGDRTTIVNIFSNKVTKLQRIIPYGSDTVVQAVMENDYFILKSEEEALWALTDGRLLNPQFNITYDELAATTLKVASYDMDEKTEVQELMARGQITSSLHYLVQNINRAIDYYDTKNTERKISHIYLTGIGANFNGMEELLMNELNITTSIIKKIEGVLVSKHCQMNPLYLGELLPVIGAVMKPIGLVPVEMWEKEKTKKNVQSVVVFGVLSILTSAAIIYISTYNLNEAINTKDALNKEILELSTIEAIYTEHGIVSETLNKIKEIEASTHNGNEKLVALITELEKALPSGIVVHSFRGTADGIMMDMTVSSKEMAALTVMQLKEIPLITRVSTYSLTEELNEMRQTEVKFSVSAQYNINQVEEGQNE